MRHLFHRACKSETLVSWPALLNIEKRQSTLTSPRNRSSDLGMISRSLSRCCLPPPMLSAVELQSAAASRPTKRVCEAGRPLQPLRGPSARQPPTHRASHSYRRANRNAQSRKGPGPFPPYVPASLAFESLAHFANR